MPFLFQSLFYLNHCKVLDDCIYVIGGFNGNTTIDNVESFSAHEQKWYELFLKHLNWISQKDPYFFNINYGNIRILIFN